MMRDIKLSGFGKARVWFSERVTPSFPCELTIQAEASAFAARALQTDRICVEAFVPRGGRVEYGLLGLAFDGDPAGRLRVEVGWSHAEGPSWKGSLVSGIDEVRLGLPEEYAIAVLRSLASTADGRFPSGTVRVCECAHGLAGSSATFFALLGHAVAELMLLDGTELTDDRLMSLLSSTVQRREVSPAGGSDD